MKHLLSYISKTRLLLLLALLCCMGARGADGDTFTATSGGVSLNYKVISESEKTCEVTKNTSVSGTITIPSTANGYTVIGIGDNAFDHCSGIISVKIPNSVTTIGYYAFAECI